MLDKIDVKIMKEITKDIINFASAHGGKILIVDKEIRLSFINKEKSISFMEAISNKHPSIKMKTCSLWKNVNVSGKELFARAS